MDDFDNIIDPEGPPAWLHLLSPVQVAWREKQILKGRDPDPHIVSILEEAGKWPPKSSDVEG